MSIEKNWTGLLLTAILLSSKSWGLSSWVPSRWIPSIIPPPIVDDRNDMINVLNDVRRENNYIQPEPKGWETNGVFPGPYRALQENSSEGGKVGQRSAINQQIKDWHAQLANKNIELRLPAPLDPSALLEDDAEPRDAADVLEDAANVLEDAAEPGEE
ncbi:hypothetical protein Tco_0941612 [Tanacetum coccineum]|uniref:Uncharacterized protein n=1 Tax=Tanacetum coccineum TaxID=301880 RepID=A0ABQ5DTR6_9ASTR